jgi:hypothetical protein
MENEDKQTDITQKLSTIGQQNWMTEKLKQALVDT